MTSVPKNQKELTMANPDDLNASRLALKENLKKLVDMAYDRGAISRTQDKNEVVYTIRIPHVKVDHPGFDLFRFAADMPT
jgi:hypothetical protein